MFRKISTIISAVKFILRNMEPMLTRQRNIESALEEVRGNTENLLQILKSRALNELQSGSANCKKSLLPFGAKCYSQNLEDGIIREIFNRVGVTNKVFVELGVGNGHENNTRALLLDDWSGVWVEGSAASAATIRRYLDRFIQGNTLKLINEFITRSNINDLLSGAVHGGEIDFLSIDLDGNDYHILEAIACINPRVIVIEYNAKFPPPIEYCMDYDESHVWDGTDRFGASIKFLEKKLDTKKYSLVACDLCGVNAFFVRKDVLNEQFQEAFTAEDHYQPARYFLSGFSSGHKPGMEEIR
jgi:hypothetical protein